ncbi:pentapeptide repeat-containing protein [Rhodopseudomonas sp. P1]|uniref:pentapeptide repeat-containing protein n=1 Tax=Rhodopseudomonas sp. P1 TaxID=3434357 RepID=UPI0031FD5E46
MSWLTKVLGVSQVTSSRIEDGAEKLKAVAELSEQGVDKFGTVTEFVVNAADKLLHSSASTLFDAIEVAVPWVETAAEITGDAIPPVKAALKIVGLLTKETDPRALGLLAFSLAYQSALEEAALSLKDSDEFKSSSAGKLKKRLLRELPTGSKESLEDFEGFNLSNCLGHKLTRQADALLEKFAEAAGWPANMRRLLVEKVHTRFSTTFRAIISDGRTKDKFDPLFRFMNVEASYSSTFEAIAAHIEYQLWRFNEAPVLGARNSTTELKMIQCPLKDIYVPLDCGALRWGDIVQLQKADEGEERKKSPFDESVGGRFPIVKHIIELIGAKGFREAIVVQGVAGAGKSAFTLNLCVELRQSGLRPIRIRMRDLSLDPRIPLLDDLAQAIAQNSGDEAFDEARQWPRFIASKIELPTIFDESVPFGETEICPYVLIFDGWDEISVSASEGFRQRIEETLRAIRREFLGNRPRPIRVILTGRPSLDVEESRFLQSETSILTIRPFTPDQLRFFYTNLLAYRSKNEVGGRQRLLERIEALVQHGNEGSTSKGAGLGIMGLPLLAMLAIWLSINDDWAPEAVGNDETTLYRRLVDMTCKHGGNVEELSATAPRIVGDKLRELLRRTAAAMTMRGTEHVSYLELERRLKDAGVPARDDAIKDVMKNNPIANLMISFFFNVGSREHGCEFIHKTFREYLFAECVVETLKGIGLELKPRPSRAPYWKDFGSDDPRFHAVQRLLPLLAAQWLTPEVSRHLHALLRWEIVRSTNDPIQVPSRLADETRVIHESVWLEIRDFLAELWDWWGEGVHLRPQPFICDDTSSLDYKEVFASRLIKKIAPTDLPRDKLPEPIRTTTIDAHLGDALFQINCTVHFAINKKLGWLDQHPTKDLSEVSLNPSELWRGAIQRSGHRYQTSISRNDKEFVVFSPDSPDGKNGYMRQYCARINSAGWRPMGQFPAGLDMSGVDLESVVLDRLSMGMEWPVSFRYARIADAEFNQCHFGRAADFEFCFGTRLQCHLVAGGETKFKGADLTDAVFRYALLWRADFAHSKVQGATFAGGTLQSVDREQLKAADLTAVRFEGVLGDVARRGVRKPKRKIDSTRQHGVAPSI